MIKTVMCIIITCLLIALSVLYWAHIKSARHEVSPVPVSNDGRTTDGEAQNKQQSIENNKLYQDLRTQLDEILDDPHVFFAPVDDAFVKKLVNIPKKNITLFVRSVGGDVHDGRRAANIIFEEGHSIVVYEYCHSACAEFLLPAAKKIIFHESPLIGFHGNSLSREAHIKEEVGDDALFCHAMMGLNTGIRKLYKKTGHNPKFWQAQYDHLIVTSKTVKLNPFAVKAQFKDIIIEGKRLGGITECYTIDVKTKHSFWYPTSEQLRTGLGLKFEGGACADDKKCYEARLDRLYPKGTSLAVGDIVYISKGRTQ